VSREYPFNHDQSRYDIPIISYNLICTQSQEYPVDNDWIQYSIERDKKTIGATSHYRENHRDYDHCSSRHMCRCCHWIVCSCMRSEIVTSTLVIYSHSHHSACSAQFLSMSAPIAPSWSIAIFAGAELIQFLGLGSNMDQGWAMNKAFCEAIGRPKLFATSLWTRTSTIHVIGNPKTMNHHNLTRTRIWSTYKKQVYIYIYIFLFFSCLPHLTTSFWGSQRVQHTHFSHRG